MYGLGQYQTQRVCALAGVNPSARVEDLAHSYATIQKVVETVVPPKSQSYRDLASILQMKIKKQHYAAQRHQYCLPVRGQKKHNGKTQQRLGLWRSRTFSFPLAKPRAGKKR